MTGKIFYHVLFQILIVHMTGRCFLWLNLCHVLRRGAYNHISNHNLVKQPHSHCVIVTKLCGPKIMGTTYLCIMQILTYIARSLVECTSFKSCTGFAFRFEHRKWNRGRNGLHLLEQPRWLCPLFYFLCSNLKANPVCMG